MAGAGGGGRGAEGGGRWRREILPFFSQRFFDPKNVDLERGYKWDAHERWQDELTREAHRGLIADRRYTEVARRAVTIESRTNLLFSFEKMALRDAIRPESGARAFAEGLYDFLYGRGSIESRF